MGDPILNCLTGACCPPEERAAVLTKWLSQFIPTVHAEVAAKELLTHCDLAPAGTLTPLVQAIAKLARGADHSG